MRPQLYLLILLCGVSAVPAVGQAPAVLRPGDLVRIEVWRQPELSGEFSVGRDSSIVHPLYRDVRVGGIPLAEAEARIRTFLTRYETDPQFVVEPIFRVAVGGEVRQPNLYSLSPAVRVAEAVALAGGPTDRGRMDRVRLVREGRIQVLDLTDPEGEGIRMTIRSGDEIMVHRRTSIFRDYVAPVASITGAALAIVNFVLVRTERR